MHALGSAVAGNFIGFRAPLRRHIYASASVAAVIAGGLAAPAAAQSAAPAQQTAQTSPVEEIVVTGTRVVRDGYEAPTPLTVVSAEAIQAAAPENIADFVRQMPSVLPGTTPQNSTGVSGGLSGVNTINLRNLGDVRTLVLLDGQRAVGATLTGTPDISGFPQGLISRVDIVTGGASAAYGSDAVAGVVNFILDKTYTGVKGSVEGGVSTYGDDESWKVSLSAGTGFANDRGHFLFSGEVADRYGVHLAPRRWNDAGWGIMNNPNYTATNGQPQRLLLDHVSLSNATPGGIIVNTALRGTAFGPGGAPYQFNYGSLVSDPLMSGGDWAYTKLNNADLDEPQFRQSAFTRASYDVTDSLQVFAQLSWSYSRSQYTTGYQFNYGNIIIKSDNAFIPSPVAAQLAALKITQFTLGSNNTDLPRIQANNARTVNRYVIGASGSITAFETDWTWNAYYQKGATRTREQVDNVTNKANFANALDAVRAPNGAIVCRSTLTSPNNGCVPYNVMGTGVNSRAVVNYVEGAAHRNQALTQDVLSLSTQGAPFSNWAGPVSVATGIEWRREGAKGAVDAISAATGLFAGNFQPTFGHYSVTEGFVETVVPLAQNTVWAKALDLNAAARFTGYSVSGYVTTWKVGATYQPVDDLRFRVTRSRDIRAPNLSDLFVAGGGGTSLVTDPFNGNVSVAYQSLTTGNLALVPESADTTGLGLVLQPSFFPGLTASVDYFNIDISNAIGSPSQQAIVNQCYLGNQAFCAAITRGTTANGGNFITRIQLTPFNYVSQQASGLDLDATYRFSLGDVSNGWNGNVTLNFVATNYLKRITSDGISPKVDTAGQNTGSGPPNWIYRGTVSYSNDPIEIALTVRGLSSGKYDNSFIACASGCPAATVANPTINSNYIAGRTYFDTNLRYKASDNIEVFLNVNNLLNADPPPVGQGPGGMFLTATANPSLYDVIGRLFRAGVRFKM